MSYQLLNIRTIQAYYDEWLLSGETQTQFLERKKLSQAMFRTNGIKRGKPKVLESSWRSFLPVEVRAVEEKIETQSVNLLLQFSNGARLHFVTGAPVDYISSLISSVESRARC